MAVIFAGVSKFSDTVCADKELVKKTAIAVSTE
jgi:hypothetical protein